MLLASQRVPSRLTGATAPRGSPGVRRVTPYWGLGALHTLIQLLSEAWRLLAHRRVLKMPEISNLQSPVRVWKQRQRRQRVFGAVVAVALLAALVYGWLYVLGVL